MPPKYAKKRNVKRVLRPKSNRRRQKTLRNAAQTTSTTYIRGDLACSDRTNVMMKTALLQSSFGSGTTYYNYQVRLNSIGVPGVTTTLDQPYGSDQWNAFYYQYQVTKCRAKITVYNSMSVPMILVMAPVNSTASFGSDTNQAMATAGARTIYLSPIGTDKSVSTSYITVDNASLIGKNRKQYLCDENSQAIFPASPANAQYLNIHASSIDASSTFTNARISIELIYTVQWFDRRVLPASTV